MKIRTLRYIAKEGIVNTYKNKLMTLASIIIVVATLIIFGFVLLIALNLETNLDTLKEQPQLEVFCYTVLDDTQIKRVEETIKNNDMIASYTMVTRAQALEKMKSRLGEDSTSLEGYDENIFPVSFIIKMKDYTQSSVAVEQLKSISGVEKVSYSQDTIDLISKVTYWIKFISGFLVIILLVISVFIIANTIKLTVFARRREINIMKYIGATDWFIRWPFVVEGVIIGIVGAILAFILTSYGYNAIQSKFNEDLVSISSDFFTMISLQSVWVEVITTFLVIGVVVGSAGSFMSLRKHLRV
ncbi:MAG: ABC transporter permease [Clostridiales bacterium]|nr:ABC transporter permease [Clostridiales bacterium]